MKELIIKQNFFIFKQSELIKLLLIYLLSILIIVCYYLFIFKYIFNINDEVVTTFTINKEKLKPIEVPNKWLF